MNTTKQKLSKESLLYKQKQFLDYKSKYQIDLKEFERNYIYKDIKHQEKKKKMQIEVRQMKETNEHF